MKKARFLCVIMALILCCQFLSVAMAEIPANEVEWHEAVTDTLIDYASELGVPSMLFVTANQHLNTFDTFSSTSKAAAQTIRERGAEGQFGNELLLLLTDPSGFAAKQLEKILGTTEAIDAQQLLKDIVINMLADVADYPAGLWDSIVMDYVDPGIEVVETATEYAVIDLLDDFLSKNVNRYTGIARNVLQDHGSIRLGFDGNVEILNQADYRYYLGSGAFSDTKRLNKLVDENWDLLIKNSSIVEGSGGAVLIRDYHAYWEHLELSFFNLSLSGPSKDAVRLYEQNLDVYLELYWKHLLSTNAVVPLADGSIMVADAQAYGQYTSAVARKQSIASLSETSRNAKNIETVLKAAQWMIVLCDVGIEYNKANDLLKAMIDRYYVNMELLNTICSFMSEDSMIYMVCDSLRAELDSSVNGVFLNMATKAGLNSFIRSLTDEGIDFLVDHLNNRAISQILLGGQVSVWIPYVKDAITLVECEKKLIHLQLLESMVQTAYSSAVRSKDPAAFYLLELYYAIRNTGLACCHDYYDAYYAQNNSVMDAISKKQEILKEQHDLFDQHIALRKRFAEMLGERLGFPLRVNAQNPYDYMKYDKQRLELIANAKEYAKIISSSHTHTLALNADGTVFDFGTGVEGVSDKGSTHAYNMFGSMAPIMDGCSLGQEYPWKNIVQVSAGYGYSIGLCSNGTVEALGNNQWGQCNVDGWRDIIYVDAGYSYTVGVNKAGKVKLAGTLRTNAPYIYENWEHVIQAAAGYYHIVGLKADGTVVATGSNLKGQCNVENWRDIVFVDAGAEYTVGLKADGSVMIAGELSQDVGEFSQYVPFDPAMWTNIVSVSAGTHHVVGLSSYGVCVYAGSRCWTGFYSTLQNWTELIAVAAGGYYTIGVRADGRLMGDGHNGQHNFKAILHDKYVNYPLYVKLSRTDLMYPY